MSVLSVIIPTYNPNLARLQQTLQGLKEQTLALKLWELVIIDNNSSNGFTSRLDLSWHPNAFVVKETQQGLTYARLKGFKETKGDFIVMVDDDNILNNDYLTEAINLLSSNKRLGAIGGKSIPLFDISPPRWLEHFFGNLALRDLGNTIVIDQWNDSYPATAPLGAGMVLRRQAIQTYIDKITAGKTAFTDRSGSSLSSSGDNDLVIEILKSGWQTGYFPSLQLKHIIPAERLRVNYLASLIAQTNYSWIQVLESHHINPWKKIPRWTLPMRQLKAWFSCRAWQGKAAYIKWRGTCGTFSALAAIKTPRN